MRRDFDTGYELKKEVTGDDKMPNYLWGLAVFIIEPQVR